MDTKEYGVMHDRYPDELHRGPMTKEEAERWVQEFEDEGGRAGAFYVVSRTVSPWKSISI